MCFGSPSFFEQVLKYKVKVLFQLGLVSGRIPETQKFVYIFIPCLEPIRKPVVQTFRSAQGGTDADPAGAGLKPCTTNLGFSDRLLIFVIGCAQALQVKNLPLVLCSPAKEVVSQLALANLTTSYIVVARCSYPIYRVLPAVPDKSGNYIATQPQREGVALCGSVNPLIIKGSRFGGWFSKRQQRRHGLC